MTDSTVTDSTVMELAFTRFVRSWEPGEPYPAGIEEAWEKLCSALIGELRKRSLLDAPPSYLGVCGWTHWREPGALEELATDCFTSVFIQRLATLKAVLTKIENVEGLTFRNIRNFLHDVQRKHNPLGFRVFTVLRAATRRAVAARTLHVLEGEPKVGNATVLGFAPWADPREAPLCATGLRDRVGTWADDLLPELVTATPAGVDAVEERLATHFVHLEDQGIEAFRFLDVVEALTSDVRARWSAIWQTLEGETGIEDQDGDFVKIVRLVRPDSGLEERQLFDALLTCVNESLAGVGKTRKSRDHLQRLWTFLRSHAAEPDQGRLPSRSKIGELLEIPRTRIPELLETLGALVENCRGLGSGR
jgi:hypothetical protein